MAGPKIGVERQRRVNSIYGSIPRGPSSSPKKKGQDEVVLCAHFPAGSTCGVSSTICGVVRGYDSGFFRLSPAEFYDTPLESAYRSFHEKMHLSLSRLHSDDEQEHGAVDVVPALPLIVNAYALGPIMGSVNTKNFSDDVFERSIGSRVCVGVIPMQCASPLFYSGVLSVAESFLSLDYARQISGFNDPEKYLSNFVPGDVNGNTILALADPAHVHACKGTLTFTKKSVMILQQNSLL